MKLKDGLGSYKFLVGIGCPQGAQEVLELFPAVTPMGTDCAKFWEIFGAF